MSRAVLLDAAVPRGYEGDDEVITTSAAAERACLCAGIPHRDLSAVASESTLAALQDEYWEQQVAWLRFLEQRLGELAPSLSGGALRPIAASAYLLKLLLDGIFVRAYESDALTRGGWSEIVHVTRPTAPPLLGEVLPMFCSARAVGYSRMTSSAGVPQLRSRPLPKRAHSAVEAVMRNSRNIRRGWPRRTANGSDDLRLLMLNSHYDSPDLLKRNAECGSGSLLLVRDRVIELRRRGPRDLGRVPDASAALAQEWREVAGILGTDAGVWEWPASWFGGRVRDMVAARVTEWIEREMPSIVVAATWFRDLLAGSRIDYVVAPFVANAREIGAFTAARASDETEAVIVEHGDIAHAAASWDVNLLFADLYVVATRELAEHLTARRSLYRERTAELLVGSYRWPKYASLASQPARRPPAVEHGQLDSDRPTLVYLVTALAADYRYLNNAWYPDAWYFGLQAAIVDELERHDRFNVVVKLFPHTEHDESPLGEHVVGLASDHVTVSTAPFSDWLPHADRVVVDMASTGLYEALVAGVPAMGLLWVNHPAREGALAALGPALQEFSTYDDAAAVVARFAADPAPFLPRLVPEGGDIRDSLAARRRSAR